MADKKDSVDPWTKLGISPTSMSQVPEILDIVWGMEKKLTVCLVGETGIGKTPIVHQWCARKGGFMYPLNFGHMSQEEVSMIMFTEKGDSFDFVPPQWMLTLNAQAEAKGCAVLFLDEWNRGDKAMVNALFTLTDERRIHSFRLHDNVMVVAAMNPSDGSYLVNAAEKDHAVRKRLNFIYATHDLLAFLEHAKQEKWDPTVTSFLKAANTHLYDVGARDAGKAFPCPSNWEKVSGLIKAARKTKRPLTSPALARLVEGQIGSISAQKFMEFLEDANTLIQPSEILNDYALSSDVRRRVAEVLNFRIDPSTGAFVAKSSVNKTRASVIANLNHGVALELFSAMPDPASIAGNLGRYIGDLPNELLSAFTAQHLLQESQAKGEQGEKYLTRLSSVLARERPYKERMGIIGEAMRNYKREANLSRETDPMQ